MRCADVNVLVYAHRADAPDHRRYLGWLDDARLAPEPLGLPSIVLSGFVRVVTHPKVYAAPSSIDVALAFVASLVASPAVTVIEPMERHLAIFTGLCRAVGATGNQVPDAYLAAIAIEQGATWWSADRGFARFRELRWRHPLDEEERAGR